MISLAPERQRPSWRIVLLTLLAGLVVDVIPLPAWAAPFRPDAVLLVLVYWCLAAPARVGVGVAWVLGLCMDVLQGSLLGQQALAYASVGLLAVAFHLRVRMYPLWQQALVVGALVLLAHGLAAWTRALAGAAVDWRYFLPALSAVLLWPWLFIILRDLRRRGAHASR